MLFRSYCACSHGVFSNGALDRIAKSQIKEFVVTNTIELPQEVMDKVPNLKVLSVGKMMAKSIEAISRKQPISDVYKLFTE